MYIKAGDTVAIIAGRDQFTEDRKGNKIRRTGKVLKTLPKTDRVIVEGINIVKKHEAPSQANEKGGIIEIEAPIHVSNVAVVDPKTGQPTKVGYRMENGEKVRYAKKSGQSLDKPKARK